MALFVVLLMYLQQSSLFSSLKLNAVKCYDFAKEEIRGEIQHYFKPSQSIVLTYFSSSMTIFCF